MSLKIFGIKIMSMKLFFKMRYVSALLFVLLVAPVVAHAATDPDLGTAASYSILAGTSVTNGNPTNISGDVGISPGAALPPNVTGWPPTTLGGVLHDSDGAALAAKNAKNAAFGALAVPACGSDGGIDYGAVMHELAGETLPPGVYCANSFHLTNGILTLNGGASDVWIFKSATDLIVVGSSSVIFTGGGLPCHVWWRVASSASLDVGSSFVGSILAVASITLNTSAVLNGRALAGTGLVSLLSNTISGPTCAAAPPPNSVNAIAPIINIKKVPNPLALPAGPGPVTYTYTVTNPGLVTMTNIKVADDKCSAVKYISGDTNLNGWLENTETWTYTCATTLTQTTINYATAQGEANGMVSIDTMPVEVIVGVAVVPPLIHIVKVPSPLSLPANGGSVKYSYTVTNPGTVALTDVTVTDNKCSSVAFVAGDTNGDSKLQSTETWTYTCTTNVPQTTTNTAIATGHANGLTAIDTALVTVVVAGSPIPPLIHIIKKPLPVVLPAAGGAVTYTYTVTNPGTVALTDVTVTDDKCSSLTLVSGDANSNSLMESNETWTYTCQQDLKATTMNTATATGHANGLTVTDVAVANVVLSPALIPAPPTPAPKLPNTGYGPNGSLFAGIVALAGLLVAATLLFALTQRKNLS